MRTATGSVLIVTADARLGEGIRMSLLRHGMPSTLTDDSAAAIRCLSQDAPAAVLVDLRLPDMDAERIVHRALACPELHGAPVIAVGGDPEDRDALLDGGCTAALPCDIEPLTISDLIAQLVHGRG